MGLWIGIHLFALITEVCTQAALLPQSGNDFFNKLSQQTANQMNMGMQLFPNCQQIFNPMSINDGSAHQGAYNSEMTGMANPMLSGEHLRSATGGASYGMNFVGPQQSSNFLGPAMTPGCSCSGCPGCGCDKNKDVIRQTTKRSTLSTSMLTPNPTKVPLKTKVSTKQPTTKQVLHDITTDSSIEPTLADTSAMTKQPTTETTHSLGKLTTPLISDRTDNTETTSLLVTNQSRIRSKPKEALTSENSFPVVIALSSVVVILCIISVILLHLWRKSRKLLRHERNELYFVEKSFRQSISGDDSSLKEPEEIIYSIIGRRVPPELPQRTTPPVTPTAPPLSASPTGNTVFKLPPDDVKHDYLELM